LELQRRGKLGQDGTGTSTAGDDTPSLDSHSDSDGPCDCDAEVHKHTHNATQRRKSTLRLSRLTNLRRACCACDPHQVASASNKPLRHPISGLLPSFHWPLFRDGRRFVDLACVACHLTSTRSSVRRLLARPRVPPRPAAVAQRPDVSPRPSPWSLFWD
jgi:hypothetical protein